MTYVKLLTGGRRKHLALAENLGEGATTLCGGSLTIVHGWKRVTHLEGDECERCAEQAFSFTPRGVPRPVGAGVSSL
jgi:hypothetical protein